MERIRSLIVGRWSGVVGGAVLVAGLALIAGLGQAERTTDRTKQLPEGSGSARAAALAADVPEGDGTAAIVVVSREDGAAISEDALADLRRALVEVQVPQVSPALGGPEGIQLSQDRTAVLAARVVAETGAAELQPVVDELRDAVRAAVPDGFRAQVTGPAAIQADLAQVFDGANVRLLAATASVVAVLLILTYRSPVLWLVPLTVIGIADQAASVVATQVLEGLDVAWDGSTTGILSVLVFGAGTNYALLLISRYRDELRAHEDRRAAMRTALARAAEPVLASASTVVGGLLCLGLSGFPVTRGLGFACAIGIAVAAFFALVALPAVLVLFGRWIFWPRRPEVGSAELAEQRTVWQRVGAAVGARPIAAVLATVGVLAALSTGLVGFRLGLPTSEQFLDRPESIAAADRLAMSFPAGRTEPTSVWTTDPSGVAEVLDETSGISQVAPGPSAGRWSSYQVVLADEAGSAGAVSAVRDLRGALDRAGIDAVVGGATAETIDTEDAATDDRLRLFPLIAGLVLLALVVLLRSAVAPVLLVLTVLATYAAGLGASWWIFSGPLDFTGVDDTMPLLAYLFLVALGVDYNIFLVTRTWEEVRAGHDTRTAVRRALAATGGVITSAGILLAAVFAVLGVLPLVVLAQLGVAICIGVLLDTLLVRTVLVPGLATLLGDRFWWPRKVPEPAQR